MDRFVRVLPSTNSFRLGPSTSGVEAVACLSNFEATTASKNTTDTPTITSTHSTPLDAPGRPARHRHRTSKPAWGVPGLFDASEWSFSRPSPEAQVKATTGEAARAVEDGSQLADRLLYGTQNARSTLPQHDGGAGEAKAEAACPTTSFLCFVYGPIRSGKTTLLLGEECARCGDERDATAPSTRRTSGASASGGRSSVFVQSALATTTDGSSTSCGLSMGGCVMFHSRLHNGGGDGVAVPGDSVFACFLNTFFLRNSGGAPRVGSLVDTTNTTLLELAVVELYCGEWYDLVGRELHNVACPADATYLPVHSPAMGVSILAAAQGRRVEIGRPGLPFSISNLIIVARAVCPAVDEELAGLRARPRPQRVGYFLDLTGCDDLEAAATAYSLSVSEQNFFQSTLQQLRIKLLNKFLTDLSGTGSAAATSATVAGAAEGGGTASRNANAKSLVFVNPRLTRWADFLSLALAAAERIVGIFTLRVDPHRDPASRAALRLSVALPAAPWERLTFPAKLARQRRRSGTAAGQQLGGGAHARVDSNGSTTSGAFTRSHAEHATSIELTSNAYQPLPWERRPSVVTSLISSEHSALSPIANVNAGGANRYAEDAQHLPPIGRRSPSTSGTGLPQLQQHQQQKQKQKLRGQGQGTGTPSLASPAPSCGASRGQAEARRAATTAVVNYSSSSTSSGTSRCDGATAPLPPPPPVTAEHSHLHSQQLPKQRQNAEHTRAAPVLPSTPKAAALSPRHPFSAAGTRTPPASQPQRPGGTIVQPFPSVRAEDEYFAFRRGALVDSESHDRHFIVSSEAQSWHLLLMRAGLRERVTELTRGRRRPHHTGGKRTTPVGANSGLISTSSISHSNGVADGGGPASGATAPAGAVSTARRTPQLCGSGSPCSKSGATVLSRQQSTDSKSSPSGTGGNRKKRKAQTATTSAATAAGLRTGRHSPSSAGRSAAPSVQGSATPRHQQFSRQHPVSPPKATSLQASPTAHRRKPTAVPAGSPPRSTARLAGATSAGQASPRAADVLSTGGPSPLAPESGKHDPQTTPIAPAAPLRSCLSPPRLRTEEHLKSRPVPLADDTARDSIGAGGSVQEQVSPTLCSPTPNPFLDARLVHIVPTTPCAHTTRSHLSLEYGSGGGESSLSYAASNRSRRELSVLPFARRASSAISLPRLRRYSLRVAAAAAEAGPYGLGDSTTGRCLRSRSPTASASASQRASSAHSSLPAEQRIYPLVQLFNQDERAQQAVMGEELLERNELELHERRLRRWTEADFSDHRTHLASGGGKRSHAKRTRMASPCSTKSAHTPDDSDNGHHSPRHFIPHASRVFLFIGS